MSFKERYDAFRFIGRYTPLGTVAYAGEGNEADHRSVGIFTSPYILQVE